MARFCDRLGLRAAPRSPWSRSRSGTPPARHGAAVGQVDQVAVGLVADPLADQPDEVRPRRPGSWKPTRSAPSRPSSSWRRHGSCWNSSAGGNGMCRKKPIRRSGRSSRSICRHQLQLVVVHPDRGVLGGHRGGLLGEPPVDPHVGVPPLAVELRLGDHVVVERPQGGVGEALVELLDLVLGAARSGSRDIPSSSNGSRSVVGAARPADPGAVVGAHHRLDRGDQAAGGARASRGLPSALVTRSTGSRFATMTRSAGSVRWTRLDPSVGAGVRPHPPVRLVRAASAS